MEGKLKFLRYIAYGLEILILYVVCGIPGFLPSFVSIKPMVLIPVALSIAVFESEIPAMIIGMICGFLLDTGADTSIGYYTLILTVLCFIIGYCQRNFFIVNFLNASIIGVCSVVGILLVHFLLFYLLPGCENPLSFFLQHYLIRMVYTLIFWPLLFCFNGLFRSSMKE